MLTNRIKQPHREEVNDLSDKPEKMPHAELAKVPELKVTAYLLRDDHPEGGSKSRFLRRFGFDETDWRCLKVALYQHAGTAQVVNETESPHGVKYEIRGELESPDGRNPEVLTVWIIERGDSSPMFVTLNPSKRRLRRDDRRA